MYLKSRKELDHLAANYSQRPAMRHSIRMRVHGSTADILLIIFWGQGSFACERAIAHIAERDSGIVELIRAREKLSAFDRFNDAAVNAAAWNVSYLITMTLDDMWCGAT